MMAVDVFSAFEAAGLNEKEVSPNELSRKMP